MENLVNFHTGKKFTEIINIFQILKLHTEGHPGGPVVKNLPANAGDMGLKPMCPRTPAPGQEKPTQ